jgi:hypothetical protein
MSRSFLAPIVLDQFIIVLIGLVFILSSFKVKHIGAYALLIIGFIGLTSINEQSLTVLSSFFDMNSEINSWLNYRDEVGLFSLIALSGAFIYHTILLIKTEFLWKGIVIGVFYLFFILSMFFENSQVSNFGILLASLPTTIICLKSDLKGVNHLFYLTWLLVSCLTILRLISFI